MALITTFRHRPDRDIAFKSTVECGWTVGTVRGERILHLETYGSSGRQVTGRPSQFVHLDKAGAAELLKLLRTAFPGLE